ncbi:hypothetical protein GGU10DRAFT_304178 [Lentinula aff. detonsa]|uniref:Extracellular mutant protein 11 C-terminal domain-containing protein n=1 Tax=Lentinula aff. detonsa TaxID=2804958 RepID=A0AA38TZ65_9AGAR|nr:hypothetical protein GGU10DRAFT_304178 [Lentinula aff. detonsa]
MLKSSPALQLSASSQNKGPVVSDHETPSAKTISGKPSNLNGLLKKSSGSHSGLSLSGRKSNANQVSGSAKESALTKSLSIRRDQAGTPSVFAPKPLNAVSAADLLFSSSIKSPALPNCPAPSLHIANETHIPMKSEGNPYPVSQYKFGNAPPQRVLLHNDDSATRATPASLIGLIPNHAHDRTTKKRSRAELDADDDVIYANHMDSGPTKRYETNETLQADPFNPQARFSPELLSSPMERRESPQSTSHEPRDYRQHTSGNGGGDSGIGPPSPSNGSNERGGDALDKLLGCQAHVYIEDHMEKYEQLATKWKDCSMEEWVKGADEIMAKYVKILDFVKNHMTTKLKLFTSFDQQLEAHNSVLNDRAKVLDGVKSKLVVQSGSILA